MDKINVLYSKTGQTGNVNLQPEPQKIYDSIQYWLKCEIMEYTVLFGISLDKHIEKWKYQNKADQISWKIAHNIIYTNQKLVRMVNQIIGICCFCNTENQTLTYFYHSCNIVQIVWEYLWCFSKVMKDNSIEMQ